MSNTMISNDEKVQQVLRNAGLESAPIDPSSLDALRQYVQQEQQQQLLQKQEEPQQDDESLQDKKPAAIPTPTKQTATASWSPYAPSSPSVWENWNSTKNSPPMKEIDPRRGYQRKPSELSVPSSIASVTTTGSVAGSAHAVAAAGRMDGPSRIIMEQLEFQTNLLLEMHRRMDHLTAKVEQLESGAQPRSTGSPLKQFASSIWTRQQQTQTQQSPPATTLPTPANTRAQVPPTTSSPQTQTTPSPTQQQQQQQQQQPAIAAGIRRRGGELRGVLGLLYSFVSPFVWFINSICDSRIVLIVVTFWKMRHRHVRNMDGGLIFKVLFLGFVVSSRLGKGFMSSSSSELSSYQLFKLRMGMTLFIVGLLYHLGYVQYLYKFVVKDEIPRRIWNREPLDGVLETGINNDNNNNDNNRNREAAAAGRPNVQGGGAPNANANNNGNNVNNNNNNWRATFLGGVIVPRLQQNPIVAAITDIFYLLGSFIFSIFPMWRPEGPPPQRQEQQQEQQGIPNVAPPRDPTEADDNDDD